MILMVLEHIVSCSNRTSCSCGGAGIGWSGKVNDGDVSDNESTREDGKDIITASSADIAPPRRFIAGSPAVLPSAR
jgi:hypothetical protein